MAVTIWCVALAVALLAAGARGPTTGDASTTAAAAMLGPDGLTTRYVSGDDQASATWLRGTGGAPMGTSGPDAFGWWAVATDLDQATATLARFSWSSDGAHGDDLYSIVGGAVRREVTVEGRVASIYTGGLVELPADVRDGSTWTSQGLVTTMTDGAVAVPVAYTSQGSATSAAAPDLASAGCLDVVVTRTVQGAPETSSARTWCPGRGIVAFAADGTSWRAATSYPARSVSSEPGSFDWSRAGDLRFSTVDLTPSVSAAARSMSLLTLSYVARPALLPGGAVVGALKQNSDVVALDPAATTGNRDRTVWRAHPGAVVVTCVTLGEVTVAVTSDRRVSAYGPTGLALWSTTLPDTATTRPVAFAGHIVVAGVDGTLTALDPATGAVAWRAAVPNEIQVRPVVAGDDLVVVDEGGAMAVFAPDGTQRWRSAELPAATFAVVAGVVVVSERGSASVRGYDLATGTKLWRTWEPSILRSIADVDGVAVGYASSGLVAFDPATGTRLWSRPGVTYDGLAAGARFLVLTADSIVAVDRSGAETRWEHGITSLDQATGYLMVSGDTVAVISSRVIVRGVVT